MYSMNLSIMHGHSCYNMYYIKNIYTWSYYVEDFASLITNDITEVICVMTTQIIYNSSDVAQNLGIKESTLRKYCLLMEEENYKFYKNEHGMRGFYDKDLIMLRKLITLKSSPDITLKQAVKSLLSIVDTSVVTDPVMDETTDISVITPDTYPLDELKGMLSVMYKKMEEQQEDMSKLLKKNDQLLVQSLKESLHNKKLLLEIQEQNKILLEVAATKEKKSLFSRIFNRK